MLKHKWLIFIVLTMAVLLSACDIKSINPLFRSEDDLIAVEGLSGKWVEPGKEDRSWTFQGESLDINVKENTAMGEFEGSIGLSSDSSPAYSLVYAEGKDTAYFGVFLVKINDHVFADIYLTELDFENSMMENHVLAVHTFAKVEIDGDKLSFHQFNGDWLQDLIEENRIRIAHEETLTGEIILTASPEELQKFVAKYADEPKAYGDEIILNRKDS